MGMKEDKQELSAQIVRALCANSIYNEDSDMAQAAIDDLSASLSLMRLRRLHTVVVLGAKETPMGNKEAREAYERLRKYMNDDSDVSPPPTGEALDLAHAGARQAGDEAVIAFVEGLRKIDDIPPSVVEANFDRLKDVAEKDGLGAVRKALDRIKARRESDG